MKTLMITLVTLMSFSASALSLKDSSLSARHQAAIKEAVIKECHFRKATFELIESIETPIRVDQGILDYDFEITLKAAHSVDQGLVDMYIVKVESHYFDQYDHEADDWGSYLVSSVKCELI